MFLVSIAAPAVVVSVCVAVIHIHLRQAHKMAHCLGVSKMRRKDKPCVFCAEGWRELLKDRPHGSSVAVPDNLLQDLVCKLSSLSSLCAVRASLWHCVVCVAVVSFVCVSFCTKLHTHSQGNGRTDPSHTTKAKVFVPSEGCC